MPCKDHNGPLGLGPGTEKLQANCHHYGRENHKNHTSQRNCKGYGFGHLFEILDLDNEPIKNYKKTEKEILLKKLNDYLNKLKNLQNRIEEKINIINHTSE